MSNISFGTANGRKLNEHHVPINSIGTFAVNGRQVTGCLPLSKGDKAHVSYSQFSRLAPLVAPTFGSFNIKTMAFFVPAHTIWRGYRSWITNSADSSVQNAPLNFSLEDITYLLTGSPQPSLGEVSDGEFVEFGETGACDTFVDGANSLQYIFDHSSYDICWWSRNEQAGHTVGFYYTFGNFTSKGRLIWNSLICLGYNFPTFINDMQTEPSFVNLEYWIEPLHALSRACYDWLYPSAYVNQQGFAVLFEQPLNTSWSDQSNRRNLIEKMLDTMFNQYDQDFYTSLWSKPNQVSVGSNQGKVDGIGQGYGFINTSGDISTSPGSYSSRVVSGLGGVITNGATDGSNLASGNAPYNFSTLMLRWLTSISDFALRNNIGGARYREWVKAHFGYVTESDTCDESLFLRIWSDPVNIQDVTNMTSAENSGALGELAGKAYSSGEGDLKYQAKEPGFLIFITECKPNVGYYQGTRPWCRALTDRFQLYTPEFDGVGMEGIPRLSVFGSYTCPNDVTKAPLANRLDAFGFAPKYSERYKIGHDNLFGDFRFRSRGRYMDSWHTMRDVLYGRNNLALDAAFLSVDNQYQRIFRFIGDQQSEGVTYDVDDKIWCFLSFNITKYSSAKSLGDSLPFFDQSGQSAHMSYEGSEVK